MYFYLCVFEVMSGVVVCCFLVVVVDFGDVEVMCVYFDLVIGDLLLMMGYCEWVGCWLFFFLYSWDLLVMLC